MRRTRDRGAARPEGGGTRGSTQGTEHSPVESIAGSSPTAARRTWLLALLLVGGTIIAYLPVWHAGLIWDDRSLVIDNPLIQRADGLWRLWFSTEPVDYYPVTSTMLWVEWRLWGPSLVGYHGVNVLLHALGAFVLWRVLARLKVPGSWLAAAIFAVHPVNVESVAWITERKNTLAMVFFLLSLLCFSRFDGVSSFRAPRWRWYWLSLAAFLLAMLSKTVVAPLPLVLLGLAWWQRGKVRRTDVLHALPFFAVAAAIGLISLWFQSHRAIGTDIVRTDSFWARLAGAGWAIWFYLYKVVLPIDLRSIYPRWRIDGTQWWSYLPGLLVAGAFWLFWRYRRTWGKAALVALAYFVVMLLPVLGFLDIGFMLVSLVADRWQYFAIIGPIVLAASAIATVSVLAGKALRVAAMALGGALLVGLAALTWRQSGLYSDPGTFWRAVLATNSESWVAHNNLGGFLVERGELDEAMVHFTRAVEIRPGYATAHYNLAGVLREKGQADEAMAHLRRALEIAPNYVEAHNSLAKVYSQKGQAEEAIVHLRRALEIDPGQAEAHNNLANVLWQKGEIREAVVHYQKALELRPDYAVAHHNLGDVLQQKGEVREAAAHYERALQLRPDFAPAHNSLAWLLATTPEPSIRNGARAIELAVEAERLSGGRNPVFIATLAAALAEAGRFSEAVETIERAMRLASAQNKVVLANRLREQSAQYQAGSPYRDAGRAEKDR